MLTLQLNGNSFLCSSFEFNLQSYCNLIEVNVVFFFNLSRFFNWMKFCMIHNLWTKILHRDILDSILMSIPWNDECLITATNKLIWKLTKCKRFSASSTESKSTPSNKSSIYISMLSNSAKKQNKTGIIFRSHVFKLAINLHVNDKLMNLFHDVKFIQTTHELVIGNYFLLFRMWLFRTNIGKCN